MTPHDFCVWLKDFFEIAIDDAGCQAPDGANAPSAITARHVEMIRRRLDLVPLYAIHPPCKRGRPPDPASKSGRIRELLKSGMSKPDIVMELRCSRQLVHIADRRLRQGREPVMAVAEA